MSEFIIRSVTSQDLDQVARVHIASFSDRALSQLGKGAVQCYYRSLLEGFPYSNPICAVTPAGVMTGFCFNGIYSGSFSGFVSKYKWFLISVILSHPWLIFNPLIREQSQLAIRSIMKRLRFNRKQKKVKVVNKPVAQAAINSRPWGILSIAVDPAYQRKGIAQLMMSSVETYAKVNGFQSLNLSVHTNNIPATRFYEKMGWQKMPPGADWDGKMVKRLS